MTTYGHEKYIEEAINGVLLQEGSFNLELIIADDNSPDNTEAVVRGCLDGHPRNAWVKYTKHNKNKGMVPNLIWGLQQADGEYIAVCEGDDYWTDPIKLQKQIDYLEEHPDCVITYGSIEAFNETGILKDVYGGAERDLSALELMKSPAINTQTICFRNVIEKLPNEIYCARIPDLFFWSLLGFYGSGKYLQELGPVRYRVHGGGIFSGQSKSEKLRMWLMTSGALFAYHRRVGNAELASYFQEKNLIAAIKLYGPRKLINFGFKRFLRKILRPRN
jgi:glycosyltransferase involved in cell wall biosynthesis